MKPFYYLAFALFMYSCSAENKTVMPSENSETPVSRSRSETLNSIPWIDQGVLPANTANC